MNTRDFGADQPATYILSARRLWENCPVRTYTSPSPRRVDEQRGSSLVCWGKQVATWHILVVLKLVGTGNAPSTAQLLL